MSTDHTPERLMRMSPAALLERRLHVAWELANIEGQLIERADDPDEQWRTSAKTAAHYKRRDLAAISNALAIRHRQQREMWSSDDHGESVIVALKKLIDLYEASAAIVEADDPDDRYWDNLIHAVNGARDVYLQHPASP